MTIAQLTHLTYRYQHRDRHQERLTSRVVRRSPGPIPRWRLAWEGPFLSSSSLHCFGDGCAICNTTYRPSDYATPTGEFGVPVHHPRFLEWIGVPVSVGNGTRDVAAFSISGPGYGCGSPASQRRLSYDYKFRRPRPISSVPAGYGIEDSRTRPGTPGFPFGRGGCGCHGTPGPPSVCADGGHGTVAALAGSGTHPLRTL